MIKIATFRTCDFHPLSRVPIPNVSWSVLKQFLAAVGVLPINLLTDPLDELIMILLVTRPNVAATTAGLSVSWAMACILTLYISSTYSTRIYYDWPEYMEKHYSLLYLPLKLELCCFCCLNLGLYRCFTRPKFLAFLIGLFILRQN